MDKNKFSVALRSAEGTRAMGECTDAELSKLVALIIILMNIQEVPEPAGVEMRIITDYMRTSLGAFKVDEVRLAFRLLCDCRLCPDERKPQHFGKISVSYFGQVMNLYRLWKRDNKANEPEPKQLEFTKKAKAEKVRIGLIRVFNEYKATKKMPPHCEHYLQYLDDSKKFPWDKKERDIVYSEAERLYYARKAENNHSPFQVVSSRKKDPDKSPEQRSRLIDCRCEVALRRIFDDLKVKNIDIVDFLESDDIRPNDD